MAKRRSSKSQQAQADETTTATTMTTPEPSPTISEEEIRERAYRRYLERGGGHGMDFEDWLEAEKELRTRK